MGIKQNRRAYAWMPWIKIFDQRLTCCVVALTNLNNEIKLYSSIIFDLRETKPNDWQCSLSTVHVFIILIIIAADYTDVLAEVILCVGYDLAGLNSFVILLLVFFQLKQTLLILYLSKRLVFAVETGYSPENFVHWHVAFKIVQLISVCFVLLAAALPYNSKINKV